MKIEELEKLLELFPEGTTIKKTKAPYGDKPYWTVTIGNDVYHGEFMEKTEFQTLLNALQMAKYKCKKK